jgi:hypothetical protein
MHRQVSLFLEHNQKYKKNKKKNKKNNKKNKNKQKKQNSMTERRRPPAGTEL